MTTELTKQELRDVQLSILDKVDAFCRRNEITYQLAFGTLLGAVRDGTYIPWDDDLDLAMPRADYRRFCDSFAAEQPDLDLGAPGLTPGWAYPHAKVSDRRTVLIEDTELEHDLGVNVDIFPIDHCAGTTLGQYRHRATIRALKSIQILKGLTPRRGRSGAKAAVVAASKPLVRLAPQGWLAEAIDRAAGSRSGRSPRVSIFVGPYTWDVEESAVLASTSIEFEGRTAPVPQGYDAVLTAIYGANYIEPPPEHLRVTHHGFTARWTADDYPGPR